MREADVSRVIAHFLDVRHYHGASYKTTVSFVVGVVRPGGLGPRSFAMASRFVKDLRPTGWMVRTVLLFVQQRDEPTIDL